MGYNNHHFDDDDDDDDDGNSGNNSIIDGNQLGVFIRWLGMETHYALSSIERVIGPSLIRMGATTTTTTDSSSSSSDDGKTY